MSQPPGNPESDLPGDQPTQPTQPPGWGPPPGYGQPPTAPYQPYQPYVPPPTHGKGLASMILGIISLLLCFGYGIGLLGSPIAWWLGAKSLREIDAEPGQYSGRGFAQTGQILGIVGTVLLGLFLLALVVILVIVVVVETNNNPEPRIPAQSF